MKIGHLQNGQALEMDPKTRLGNMLLLGRGGQGRSLNMVNLAVNDILSGHGGMLIDPVGDLTQAILKYIPKERKKDLTVVTVKNAKVKENMKRLEKGCDFKAMQKNPNRMVLVTLDVPLIGGADARECARHVLTQFYKVVGKSGNLSGRSLFIDDFNNAMDDDLLKRVMQSKKYKLTAVLSDQSVMYLGLDRYKKLSKTIDNLVLYNVDKLSADRVCKTFPLKMDREDVALLPRYEFYAWSRKGKAAVRARSLYPLPYPQVGA